MRAICDYAKGSKVKIVIEPHGGYSNDPDWLLAVIKQLDHPNAGCCRTSTTSGVRPLRRRQADACLRTGHLRQGIEL